MLESNHSNILLVPHKLLVDSQPKKDHDFDENYFAKNETIEAMVKRIDTDFLQNIDALKRKIQKMD